MIAHFGRRGLLHAVLLTVLALSGVQAVVGVAHLRETIASSPDSITAYDGHRAEVEFYRLRNALVRYVADDERIDLDEVTTRFDVLWSRARLFMNGAVFAAAREMGNLDEVAESLMTMLQEIEDDVFTLQRGDLVTLGRIQERLRPFELELAKLTSWIAELETRSRDSVKDTLKYGLEEIDRLALLAGFAALVLLSLLAFEAIHARRAEQRLANYQEHLEDLVEQRTEELHQQASRLEKALDRERELNVLQRRFVSMVSHEFRTPLAIMDGAAQRLKRKFDHLPKAKVLIIAEQIERSVKRLIHLMESTLSASQLQAGAIALRIDSFDIRALIDDVCADQQQMTTQHHIAVNLDSLPTQIQADGKLLRQVFSNLISNAIKYSPEGRTIWVEGHECDSQAVISVRDEGVGIPAAELPRLFEQFFRASTSTGIPGTGVGLNFVKHLVAMHEGTIAVETDEGKGSTFTVSLPVEGPEQIPIPEAA